MSKLLTGLMEAERKRRQLESAGAPEAAPVVAIIAEPAPAVADPVPSTADAEQQALAAARQRRDEDERAASAAAQRAAAERQAAEAAEACRREESLLAAAAREREAREAAAADALRLRVEREAELRRIAQAREKAEDAAREAETRRRAERRKADDTPSESQREPATVGPGWQRVAGASAIGLALGLGAGLWWRVPLPGVAVGADLPRLRLDYRLAAPPGEAREIPRDTRAWRGPLEGTGPAPR